VDLEVEHVIAHEGSFLSADAANDLAVGDGLQVCLSPLIAYTSKPLFRSSRATFGEIISSSCAAALRR
jgi:hypothetical protein